MRRTGQLIPATKSNDIIHTMPFWDQVVHEAAAGIAGLTLEKVLIDRIARTGYYQSLEEHDAKQNAQPRDFLLGF